LFIDPIGGKHTGMVLSNMPNDSTVLCYGALSGSGAMAINPLNFIACRHVLKGFILGDYLKSKGLGALAVIKKAQSLMKEKAF